MEPFIIACVLSTFFVAAFLKGTAGLGFATTSLGIMASFVDMRLAIPLVVIPSLLANALVMVDAGGFRTIFRRFWPMFAAAIPGLALGLWLLGESDTTLPRAVLGATMALYGHGTVGRHHTPIRKPRTAGTIGFFTGLVNGLTGSQVMPILPYLISLKLTKDELVQAINTSFTISSVIMLFGLGRLGLFTGEIALISTIGLIPVCVGIWLGGRVRRLLPEAVFRKTVFILLILLGLGLIARVVFM